MSGSTVCLTFDFDAISAWLHIDESRNTPTNRSRGLFGAEVGAPRLLDLLDDHGVSATWFVPGHTLDSFPDISGRIHASGHEIQHHGWSHTPPGNYESRAAELADVERAIESVEAVTGRRPTGYRSPSWDYSEHTLDILLELGFEWDSSGMARDFEPYRVRPDDAPVDEPYSQGDPTDLVAIPVSWQRDDFPAFAHDPGKGFTDERSVFRQWREGFDWMCEHVDDGVYVLTMHPQIIGHGRRLARLREFVEHVEGADAEFATVSAVAARVD